jgi:membrane protease YdiL (CAAX protease family)
MVWEARQQSRGWALPLEIRIVLAVSAIGLAISLVFEIIVWSTSILVSLFSTLGMIVVVIVYCRFIERRKLPTLGLGKGRVIRHYLGGLVLGSLMFALAVALCYLTGTLDFGGVSADIPWGFLLLFLLGFVFQGMSEELLCRGYFLVSLARRQRLPIALIISSAFFSLLHCLNPGVTPLAFLNLFLFGAFAGLYFIKSGNIWGVAALHSAWNFVQGPLFGIPVSGSVGYPTLFNFSPNETGSLINGGAFGLEGGLAVSFVLVLGIVVFLCLRPRKPKALSDWQAASANDGDRAPSEQPERS